jgi:5-methylcytosine-specific restriction endonuclease McrA
MVLPPAWRNLVRKLATGNGARPHVSEFGGESHKSLEILLELASVRGDDWQREVALVALLRGVLSIFPAVVVERPEEACRDVIEKRLEHLTGMVPAPEDVLLVMQVVKRMQLFRIGGRSAVGVASLNFERRDHRALLQAQSGRCASCGYRFKDGDLTPDPSAGEIPAIDAPLGKFDRSPRRLRRRAVLDHILPVYLGGDDRENWQILCRTCNAGKSDMLLGFESRHWFGGARIEDLTTVSARLFYMVLRRDHACSRCSRRSNRAELRVIRRDRNGSDLYPNVVTCCTDCLQSL